MSNVPDRLRLIQKRELGTITDAEYDQYLDLLRTDPGFAQQVALYQALAERATTPGSWPSPKPGRPPGWWAGVGGLALAGLVGVGWLISWLMRPPAPELLKDELRPIYAVPTNAMIEGPGYATANQPVANLPTRWWLLRGQSDSLRYSFCRDTLFLYVPQPDDTTRLDSARLDYDFSRKRMLVSWSRQRAIVLAECGAVRPLR